MRIDPAKTQKEPTYQVVLDALALTTCYPAFLITADAKFRDKYADNLGTLNKILYHLSSIQDLIKKEWGGEEMMKLSPSLRNLTTKETLNLSLKWSLIRCTNHEELLLQSSTSAYLGKLRVSTSSDFPELKFYKEYSIRRRALLPKRITNQQMRDFNAYKTYLAYATGEASPKMKRKLKKPASPSKKRTLVTEEEEEPEPAKKVVSSKKPATKRQSAGVPNEPKGKSIDTSEGTGLKPGVPDVSTADSSESENESWGDSGDEANEQSDDEDEQSDDDHEQDDDERTESND
ncbi:hypothetical protein Tco_1536819, partial [Tanacetum coccineum]